MVRDWETEIFQGQGKVREFGWPGKFGKDLKNQGIVGKFEKGFVSLQKIYLRKKFVPWRSKFILLRVTPYLHLQVILFKSKINFWVSN